MRDLVKKLLLDGVHLSTDDDNIKIKHNGTLSKEILKDIKDNKSALLDFLKIQERSKSYEEIPRVSPQNSYPLHSAQYSLWVLEKVHGDTTAYNMPSYVNLGANCDINLLKESIKKTIDRHEILRSVFRENNDGEVRQWILPSASFPLEIECKDFSDFEDPRASAGAYVLKDSFEAFDLANGPLIRVCIHQLAEDSFKLYYNMHHIISDGWSLDVLENDILSFYKKGLEGISNPLEPLRIQYKDFVAWQTKRLKNESTKGQKNYWLDKLSGTLPTIDLGSKYARPSTKTFNGKSLGTYISEEQTALLHKFSNQHRGSLFTVLLAIFKTLVYKYSGQTDIIIGTPMAGRDHKDLEQQIGFYVNTLALRNSINSNETFVDFFTKVKDATFEAYDHQMYPYHTLVRDLNLPRDLSRNPIFDIMLTLQNTNDKQNQSKIAPKLIQNIQDLGACKSKFDISISFKEEGNCISFVTVYNTDVYDDSFMSGLMRQFKTLTAQIIKDSKRAISSFNYVSEEELKTILNDFSKPASTVSHEATVLDLFRSQVLENPKANALVALGRKMTYQELDELSNHWAEKLHSYGVKSGSLVPLCLERSLEDVVLILSIMKAGGAYVPIDPSFSADRIDVILNDTASSIVVSSKKHKNLFKEAKVLSFNLIEEPSEAKKQSLDIIAPTSLAYVLYTSGTTGKPKGVMINHAALVSYLINQIDLYKIGKKERILLFSNLTFDASIEQLFIALTTGSELHVVTKETILDAKDFSDYIDREGITHLHGTPSFLNTIDNRKFSQLRRIISGGERCPASLANRWKNDYHFYNKYGPTEVTISSLIYRCLPQIEYSQTIPIGNAIGNNTIYIVDRDQHLAPINVAGEIWIAGNQVSSGYLNRPDITKEQFVDSPFENTKGQKIFKTGDFAYWLPDGTIAFMGRKDDQVKINGHRIELGEIAYQIEQVSGLAQTTVLTNTEEGTTQLKAFLVLENGVSKNEVIESIRDELIDYMVPSFFEVIEEIPLTKNGKVDKELLLKTFPFQIEEHQYVLPKTKEERILCEICEEILNQSPIGITHNFFNLGGDSIKSILIGSRLRQHGYHLKIEHVLQNPIIKDIAKFITPEKNSIDQKQVIGNVPLNPIQKSFFENSKITSLSHYNQAVLLKSSRPVMLKILEQCFKNLVTHHDAMRMTFKKEGSEWIQYNNDCSFTPFSITSYDLTNETDDLKKLNEIGNQMNCDVNLEEDELIKVGHFKTLNQDYVGIVIHHLLIDGISWRIVLEDLVALYNAYLEEKTFQLPQKTNSFKLWSESQKAFTESGKLDEEIPYWETITAREIDIIPPCKTDSSDEVILNTSKQFKLDKKTTKQLQTTVNKVYNTGVHDLLLSSLGVAIAEIFDRESTIIKLEGHGREHIIDEMDVSRTVGWFTSVFPFVLESTHSNSLEEGLIYVKESLRAIPNKGVGFGMLQCYKDDFKNDYTPSVVFNYLGEFNTTSTKKKTPLLNFSNEAFGKTVASENTTSIPLSISGIITSGELSITIDYDKDYFNKTTIDRLASSYKSSLSKIITNLSNIKKRFVTPSDLTFKNISINDLKSITSKNTIEDIYKLSPLQLGIYYHWLTKSSNALYFEQVSYNIKSENLNVEHLKTAYDHLIARHPMLRTSFTTDYANVPLQIVHRDVDSSFTFSELPTDKKKSKETILKEIREKDRMEGFDLKKPSQMRLRVVSLGNAEYEFIWNHHHIIMDGWSTGILIREFNHILTCVANDQPINLQESIPYANYISWLQKNDTEISLEYWNSYLDSFDRISQIPHRKQSNDSVSYLQKKEAFYIEGANLKKVHNFCNDLGVTLNTFLQGVWGYLLARYNNAEDVVFGAIVSGRPSELYGVEEMVGLFINTIPVRVKFDHDETPVTLFKRLQKNAIASNTNHYVNLSDIQATSDLGSDLLSHIMVFENYPIEESLTENEENDGVNAFNGLNQNSIEVHEQTNYDFNIIVAPTNTSLGVEFKYNSTVFDEKGIQSLLTHFEQLVTKVIDCGYDKLRSIEYILPSEKEHYIDAMKDMVNDYPRHKSIVQLFEEQCISNPTGVALISEEKEYTYAELNEIANKLAAYIVKDETIIDEDFICIKLDRSEWCIIAILAVLKVGAVYVPIDPNYPSERIQFIEKDSNGKFTIDQQYIATFLECIDKLKPINETVFGSPENLAYIMYTSGSSGMPKGVMVTHQNVTRLVKSTNYFQFNQADTILATGAFSFDATTFEFWGPLLNGGKLVISTQEVLLNEQLLRKTIDVHGVNVMWFTVGWFNQLIDIDPNIFQSLETILVGGDKLSPIHLQLLRESHPEITIINGYGPTENTTFSLTHEVSKISGEIPIGKPIQNSTVYILDKYQKLVPYGVIGEIYLGGDGLARGYLNRPELTKAKFIDNPYRKGTRLYKTGDMGMWLADGTVGFAGRIDSQVKIRGHRIELGEIENAILLSDSISKAVATVWESNHSKQLVVYYVGNTEINKTELKEYLRSVLPDYMQPSFFVQLDTFPLTSNGKIDFASLPEVTELDLVKSEYVEPKTKGEIALSTVWKNVLKREKISIKDSFYNLGGDSIKSIQIVSRLKQLGYSLKVEDILKFPVLEDLAQIVREDVQVSDQSEVIGSVLLSPIQKHFFENKAIQNKNHFNQSVFLSSAQPMSLEVIKKCVQKLFEHHDALRMRFEQHDKIWHQENLDISSIDIDNAVTYHDLSQVIEPMQKITDIAKKVQSSISLVNNILFKAVIFQLKDEYRLALVIHHLVVDGVSWRILLEDFTSLYTQYSTKEKIVLPSKTDSFQKWSALLAAHAKSKLLKSEISYWEDVCNQEMALKLASNKEHDRTIEYTDVLSFQLGKDSTELLQTKAHSTYSTGINDILLTSLGLALREVFETDKTVIQMEGHGREQINETIDVSRTVGWFTSIFPFVLTHKSESPTTNLVKVKEDLRKLPNNGIGFGILAHLTNEYSLEYNPLLSFNYLGDFGDGIGSNGDAKIDYAEQRFGYDIDTKNAVDCPIAVSGMIIKNELQLTLRYDRNILSPDELEQLCISYKKHLAALIEELSTSQQTYITPSDLTYSHLRLEEIIALNKSKNLEDVYELSPLQQGIYFHWLSNQESQAYLEQVSYSFRAKLTDETVIKRAYDSLIGRHAILRTQFTSDYGGLPLQVVYKEVSSNYSKLCLQSETAETRALELNNIKQEERNKGFNLENDTSQIRLVVVKTGSRSYEFIWNFHHILMDGWCLSILINDFYKILFGFVNSKILNLPKPRPYSEYIQWISKIDKNVSISYWKDYLSQYHQLATIPFKRIAEVDSGYVSKRQTVHISGETLDKLNGLCHSLQLTQNTFIQVIWGFLLSKYNNTTDVVFGSVVSGRPGELNGVEDMVGLFINTIPVRVTYNATDTPKTLLTKIHEEAIESKPHHYLNLSEVQGTSALGMDLLDHIIIFENYPIQELLEEKGASIEQKFAVEDVKIVEQTNYDFDISVNLSTNALEVHFTYNENRFDTHGVSMLVNHFNKLITEFCTKQTAPLSEIEYLTNKERTQLLTVNNDHTLSIPKSETLIDILSKQVALKPNASALIFKEEELTFKELDEISSRMALYLQSVHDVKPGDLVCIKQEKSQWFIISIFAILKLGAAYVPIDINYPEERKLFIENDSQCKVCIDSDVLSKFIPWSQEFSGETIRYSIKPSDTAYVIYTSGSTGQPKGVIVSHRAVVNIYYGWIQAYNLNTFDVRLLQLASFSFDMSVADICRSILAGGTMIITGDDTKSDPESLAKLILDNKVSVFEGTPSFVIPLMQYMHVENFDLSFLKMLILGGESFSLNDFNFLKNTFGNHLEVINSYGVTEACVDSTYYYLGNDELSHLTNNTPIGVPFPNVRLYVLDKMQNLVPEGIEGELYIGGAGVADGYLNRPDLTKEKFIVAGFDSKPHSLYRSGDIVKWLPNGVLEFLGREDDQVKIRGHRIELGEIAYQLGLNEDLNDVVVIAQKLQSEHHELIAYYVSDQAYDTSYFRDYLSKLLPDYMIPNYFFKVDSMPMTPNGKLDKKALPDLNNEMLTHKTYVAPSSVEEKILVEVWEDVLKSTPIGMKDSFYNLGGDSIKSIQIVARLKQKGFNVKVEEILRNPILQDLAVYVVKNTRVVDQSDVQGQVNLTPIQHYLLESDRIVNKHHYNQSVLLRSKKRIDPKIIDKSLLRLVKHHDALRIRYVIDNPNEQYNLPFSKNHFTLKSFNIKNSENEISALREKAKVLQSSIDITTGPLVHVGHFIGRDNDYLALIIHHMVVDGISWRIILEDFNTLYEALENNNTSVKLPSKTDSFRDWADLQLDYVTSDIFLKEKPFWKSISATKIPEIPTDFKQGGITFQYDKTVKLSLNDKITTKFLTRIHQAYKTQANDVLLSCLSLALKDTFGIQKSAIKLEGHGRETLHKDIDISRTVGWFSSEYPVILDISGASDLTSSLIRVKEDLRQIPNKGIGYGMFKYLVDDFSEDLSPSILFNYLGDFGSNAGGSNTEESIFDYSGEAVGNDSDSQNGQDVLLDISGMIVSGKLTISIAFSSALFKEGTLQSLCDFYKQNLVQMIDSLSEINEYRITPSDLTFKGFSIEELEEINTSNNIEDIYELSPLQQGMYYHWLLDPEGSEYLEQISYRLKAPALNIDAVHKAYNQLIERYSVLRTGFINEYQGILLQIVYKKVADSFTLKKVPQGISSEAFVQQEKREDQEKGFDLNKESQMRLTILDLKEGSFEFIWTHHHILMDGWCMSILLNDFYSLLSQNLDNSTFNLPEPKPYSTYIDWLSKLNEDASLAYWKQYLKEYGTIAEIPFKKHDGNASYKLVRNKLVLNDEIFTKVQKLCNQLNITQNTFIQCVWGYLLARYTGRQDVVFGAVVSGRPAELPGIEDMVGLFINTIPVRISYNRDDTPIDILNTAHNNAIDSQPHHYLNLSEVQTQSKLGMDLIDHVLIFENYPIQEVIKNDANSNQKTQKSIELSVENVELVDQTSYDFSIVTTPSKNAIEISFEFNRSVYDEDAMASLPIHFSNVIEQFCDNPQTNLRDLTYLAPEEEIELLQTFNATEVVFSNEKTFLDLFKEKAQSNPAAIAVIAEETTLNYKQLDELSNAMAAFIIESFKPERESIIALNIPRNEWLVVSILAVFKSRCAYLPIDPSYPQERIQYLLEDSRCEKVIDSKLLKTFIENRESYKSKYVSLNLSGSDLAYVIYTSGSTGFPKGVLIEHAGMLNHMYAMIDSLELNSDSVIVQNAPSTFDISIWQLLNALVVGGTTSIYNKDIILEPLRFLERIQLEKATVLQVVPSYLKPLLEAEKIAGSKFMKGLRYLLVTGEAISKDLIDSWFDEYKNVKVVNAYGPAEASDDITLHIMKESPKGHSIPIGKPVQNMQLYILDENLQLCAKGLVGEICVSGIGLSRGYLERPELTAEKFVKNPYNQSQLLYKTGDFGKWLPDGAIEFLGRDDSQVKVNGFRVELSEIEYHLRQKEGIEEAVVLLKDAALVAFICSSNLEVATELKSFLLEKLPDHMCPLHFEQLEEMPLTLNGKVNRKELLELITNNALAISQYVSPKSQIEEKIVAIIAKEIKRNPSEIGILDNFFDLGMNSIRLLKVLNGMNKEFQITIKPALLFEFPNVSELAKNVISDNTSPVPVENEEIHEKNSEEIDEFLTFLEDDWNS